MDSVFSPNYSLGKLVSVFTILALLFSSTVPAIAASWNVNNAQQYVSDDAMLICTGSTFKWISTVDFYASGKLTFIEPPADAPNNIDNLDCSNVYINDPDKQPLQSILLNQILVRYQAIELDRLQRPFTSFPYQTAHSRAPPII